MIVVLYNRYIDIDGGAVLILCNEGGLVSSNDNINNILQVYGISINNDSLIRSAHHPNYHHPKEVLIYTCIYQY